MHDLLTRGALAAGTLAVLAAAGTPAGAQVRLESRAAQLTITGRVHTQFNTSSVDGEAGSEFLMRRARLTAELEINDFVSGKVQPDYGEGGISLKDAYLQLSFSPAFQVQAGQFKRPFDVFELTSSTQILVVERAGGIRGVDACAGPGGACTFSRLTEKLQFSDRDIGFQVFGSPSSRFSYAASVTNGAGANEEDATGAKSFTGRVAVMPTSDVRIAGNVALHDYAGAAGNAYASAIGGDVEIGNYEQGLHVQAGIVTGDNWQNLVAAGGDPSRFVTAQGIVTYKIPVEGNPFVAAVEPVGRISWADPNTGLADDGGMLFTPGFVVYFTGRNKLGANVDVWSPAGGGDTEWSLKVQTYLHF